MTGTGVPQPLPVWHPARLIATGFLVGHLPGPAGTWGSLAALAPAWYIARWGGPWALLAAGLGAAVLGIWTSAIYARALAVKDPSSVVIDEISGQWLTLVLVPPDLRYYAVGFLLFRLLDITKPGPIGWADRQLPSGWGIMIDDVIAGLVAMAVMTGVVALW